jgi:hypothetical protein
LIVLLKEAFKAYKIRNNKWKLHHYSTN